MHSKLTHYRDSWVGRFLKMGRRRFEDSLDVVVSVR